MAINKKQSSPKLASQAAKALQNENSSEIKKKLAASVVAQARTGKQTGAEMETIASDVMKSSKYSEETKSYAASLLSQSNKPR
ncbi:TPA: hypothetical protein ACNH1V_003118 [Citrobacter koseri]|uniref:hypothetical protein n=1 Tax=uncultured Citrobacter sp. TaxID=200446 RepID=UPI0025994F85|nr:hypothetical protein [uncultured Citrobacter sp.]